LPALPGTKPAPRAARLPATNIPTRACASQSPAHTKPAIHPRERGALHPASQARQHLQAPAAYHAADPSPPLPAKSRAPPPHRDIPFSPASKTGPTATLAADKSHDAPPDSASRSPETAAAIHTNVRPP